jgi:hypothetical protein
MMMRLRLNPWAVRGFDRWGLFLLGMAGVVVMFLLEGYLREGVARRSLTRRTVRATVALLVLAAVTLATSWLVRNVG